ncbi:MAG: spore coat protein [Clostridia bacterium]|nr:spore coat protein [Clostridia bacterium]
MTQNQPWKENQPWNQSGSTPLNDQERAFDLLYQEKALMSNIASEMLEVSPVGMRQVMQDCFNQISADQLEIFNLMQQQGWYPTKPAQAHDVQTAKQKYQQMRTTL